MKIAALGRTQMLYKTIKALKNAGHEMVLIGTGPAVPEYTKTEDDFRTLAEECRCPFFSDIHLDKPNIFSLLGSCGADIGISINWPTIIPGTVLTLFKQGIINSHTGDLPRYRGNACPNWAILVGESNIVLTLHRMVEDLDAGPILCQREYPLTEATYIGEVYRFTESNVPEMFVELINNISKGEVSSRNQPEDPSLITRCYPRIPEDSEIHWDQSAEFLARLVRASSEPFNGAYTYFNGQKLLIWRAVADSLPFESIGIPGQVVWIRKDSGEVGVLCQKGILVLQVLQPEGSDRREASDVIRSTRVRLGMSLSKEIELLRKRIMFLEEENKRIRNE
jgi:methionyl-tRNA formyltransferase